MDEYSVRLQRSGDRWFAEVGLYPEGLEPLGRTLGHMHTGETPQDALEKLAKYWRREEALSALIAEDADYI